MGKAINIAVKQIFPPSGELEGGFYPIDWSYTLTSEPALFADRGFTGHENLPWFNLINMNGRLYDPLVGRFLTVDNVIQDPTSTQNYNRYSYCLNNPLKFTDPSGWQMAPADKYWDLGHSPTNIVDFSMGNYYGEAISVGGGNSGANPGGAGVNWKGYMQAKMDGYTGSINDYLNEINSPDYNGTVANHYFTYENYIDKNGEATVKGIRHDVVIKPRNSSLIQQGNTYVGLFGVAIDASREVILTNSNLAYNIAYIPSLARGVNSLKPISFGLSGLIIGSDFVLSLLKDPSTGNPYQSWGETYANTSVSLFALRLGGWYGVLIQLDYMAAKAYIKTSQEHPEWLSTYPRSWAH
jgi:RHS repeat-associated protein